VRKDPALTEREVIDFCRKSLAAYKAPKHVYFRSDLPKSNVGKILRKALRDELTHPSVNSAYLTRRRRCVFSNDFWEESGCSASVLTKYTPTPTRVVLSEGSRVFPRLASH